MKIKMIFPTVVVLAIAASANLAFSANEPTGSGITNASGSSLSGSSAGALAQEEVKVVYPSQATEIAELDSSTVSKRAEPPVREESEFDPVTPIGQIKAVRDALSRLEDAVASLRSAARQDDDALVAKLGERLPTRQRVDEIFPLLIKSSEDGAEAKSGVASLLKTTDGLGAKIDSLAKTTENLRATVESAQKTAASIEKIRTSRWSDLAVFAILALVLIQLVGKVGAFVATRISATRSRFAELAEAYELAKAELAKKQPKETKSK